MLKKINISILFKCLLLLISQTNEELKIVDYGNYFAYKNEMAEEDYDTNCYNYKFCENSE